MMAALDQPTLCPILIGRDAALDALGRGLDRVRAGTGRTLVLAGEAGIGKSRLVAEARARADRAGFLVVQGQCFEPDRAFPYAPLLDLLRTHLADLAGSDLAAALGRAAPAMVRLLPELAARLPAVAPPPALDPDAEKRRLCHDLAAYLTGLAATRPLLLVVEDLHWSDETSLEFLLALARRAALQPLLLLLTYRSDEVGPELAHLLAELDRGRLASEIDLDRLTIADVEAMLRATLSIDRPLRREFVDLVVSLTDGNPFFIEEVLKVLVASGEIYLADGAWVGTEIGQIRAPRSVQDAVRRRTVGLSDPARRAVQLAAVAGRRFDVGLLQDLLGVDELTLLGLLRELAAAQLVVEETADRIAFRHALTRQAIVDDLLGRERRLLHGRIAAAIARRYAGAIETYLGDLAHHYAAAEAWAEALAYGARAAEQALAMQAPRAAVEHLTRAIVAGRSLGLEPAPALYRSRGRAYDTLGDFDRARADHEAALAAARTAGDRRAEWQALLDLGFLWASRDYARSGDDLRRALTLAREIGDPALIAHSLNRVGNWHMNAGDPLAARRHHEEALAIFEQLGDRAGMAETVDLLGTISLHGGDVVRSKVYFERAVTLFRERDDRRGLSSSLVMLATAGTMGMLAFTEVVAATSPAEVNRQGAEAVELARQIGWRAGEAFALLQWGYCLAAQGEYGQALAATRRSLAIAEEIEHRQWIAFGHVALGMVSLELPALPAARDLLERALALAREFHGTYLSTMVAVFLARACLQDGDVERAETVLDAAFRADAPAQPALERMGRWVRGELMLARGDPARALTIADELIESAANRSPDTVIPALWLLRGEALAALDRSPEAEAAFRAAAAEARRAGARPLLWRLHLALARLHHAAGRRAEAEAEWGAARAIAGELAAGLPEEPVPELDGSSLRAHFLAAAAALAPRARPLTALQAAKQSYGGLTTREREVATLIARGRANRAIADELSVSERTVETHITNALAKLGFASRAQIAAWAVEKGLVGVDPAADRSPPDRS